MGLLNSLAASALIGSVIAPFIAGATVDLFWSVLVAGVGGLLHLLAQMAFDSLKLER